MHVNSGLSPVHLQLAEAVSARSLFVVVRRPSPAFLENSVASRFLG
jgi:hypothetical protein